MALFLHRFTVEGRGEFPLDMLRYDSVFPSSATDSSLLRDQDDRRRVRLAGFHPQPWEPTYGRWESFGWSVVWNSQEKQRAP